MTKAAQNMKASLIRSLCASVMQMANFYCAITEPTCRPSANSAFTLACSARSVVSCSAATYSTNSQSCDLWCSHLQIRKPSAVSSMVHFKQLLLGS